MTTTPEETTTSISPASTTEVATDSVKIESKSTVPAANPFAAMMAASKKDNEEEEAGDDDDVSS